MSKTILLQLKAEDKASAKIKKVEKSVTSLGHKTTKSMKTASVSVEEMQTTLNKMGNRFRFMTIAFGALALGAISVAKSFLSSAIEMQNATLKVGVFAVSTGQSMDKANKAALNLASTGLVSVIEASNSLANLLATGMNIDKAEILLKRMLNAAVLQKESLTDTYGLAVEKSTLGVRILQERQVDAIGINFRLNQVVRAYGKTIGKTNNEMSTHEKQLAIIAYLMKKTERFVGGADLAMNTLAGTMARLNVTTTIMKAKIGETLTPLFGTLANVISSLSRGIGSLAQKHAILTSVMISGIVIMVTVVAVLTALGAVIPLVTEGVKGLRVAMLFTLGKVGAQFALKFLAIAAIIGSLIYLVLKATGQWNKWTDSMKNLAQRIKDTINPFKEQGNAASTASAKIAKQVKNLKHQIFLTTRSFRESMAKWVKEHDNSTKKITKQIDDLVKKYKIAVDKINSDFTRTTKDNSIAHARKTEDLKRDIDEEVSKGIWADQTKIRSLKLSLKRENEDYARQNNKLTTDKKKRLTQEATNYVDKLTELKNNLDKEVKMYQAHAVLINKARSWPILDAIQLLVRSHKERLAELKQELIGTKSSTAGQVKAYDDVGKSIDKLNGKLKLNQKTNVTYTSNESSGFGKILSIIAKTMASIIGLRIITKVVMSVWSIATEKVIGFTAKAVGGFGLIKLAIGEFVAAIAAVPWAVVAAEALIAFSLIEDSTLEYRGVFDGMLDSFTNWGDVINRRKTDLEKLYKSGEISQEEFRSGIQRLIDEQGKLSRLLKTTYNDSLPTWLSTIVDLYGQIINKIKTYIPLTNNIAPAIQLPNPNQNMSPYNEYMSPYYPYARAEGGSVYSNRPYLVGEQGPEVFVPSNSGQIIPNSSTSSPITININNPTIREDTDIRRIADSVGEVLSRRQYLRHLT